MNLLPAQRKLAQALLERLHDQANSAVTRRHDDEPVATAWTPAAHRHDELVSFNTYTIAGTRGAGKSTVLKAVRTVLPHLGTAPRGDGRDARHSIEASRGEVGLSEEAALALRKRLFWRLYPTDAQDIFDPGGLAAEETSRNLNLADQLFRAHATPDARVISGKADTSTALVLPIIDPSQFEDERHTVMEQVIAHLSHVVWSRLQDEGTDQERSETASAWFDRSAPHAGMTKQTKLQGCLSRLRGEISRGWTFAQEFGQKMLIDDSASFDEFVSSRAAKSVDAALRHRRWRQVVDEVLDCFSARLLVVCFDDCDLAPQHTVAVIEAVRIYLSSPRIAVILATDLDELRHNLSISRLGTLRDAASATAMVRRLSSQDEHRLRAMVDREFVQADLFLDKVVPVANRLHLHLTPYLRGVGLLDKTDGRPALPFAERDRLLLDGAYPHVFEFLTPRDVENIRRLVTHGDRALDVGEMLSISSAASEIKTVAATIDWVLRPVTVYLSRADELFLRINVDVADDDDDDDDYPDRNRGAMRQDLWAIGPTGERSVFKEPRFERANALRGTLIAFLVDRRLVDFDKPSLPVSVVFQGGDRLKLPPRLDVDLERLQADPYGLLADLESYLDLPRNARSLAASAKLLNERGPVESTSKARDIFLASLLEGRWRAGPTPRAGKLPFLMLVERALTQPRFKQDIVYRISRFVRALTKTDERQLSVEAETAPRAGEWRPSRADIWTRLADALDEIRRAVYLINEAASIYNADGGRWPSLTSAEIEGMLSNAPGAWQSRLADLFRSVTRTLGGQHDELAPSPAGAAASGEPTTRDPVAAASTGAVSEASMTRAAPRSSEMSLGERAAVEILVAAFGPLSILRYRFGTPAMREVDRAARDLMVMCLPHLDLTHQRVLEGPSDDVERHPTVELRDEDQEQSQVVTLHSALLEEMAGVLAVPTPVLRNVLASL